MGRSADDALVERLALGALLACNLALIAQFFVVALGRITYPFELEWFEGLVIDNAWRLVRGLPIYGPPDATFAASHYPPLLYLVALPFLTASGWALWGARLVSVLAVAGCGAIAARVVRRAGGSWAAVVFALGTAAAFYAPMHHWYDLARVDALTTFFVVAGVAALTSPDDRPGQGRLWCGAALLICAALTKQTAALFSAAALVSLAGAREWARLRTLAAALAGLGLAAVAILWLWSGGWITLVYTMPRHHQPWLPNLRVFLSFTLGMAPYLALAAAGVRRPTTRAFLAQTVAALVVAAVSLTKVGGDTNSAMPAVFLGAIGAALGGQDLWRALGASPALRILRTAGVVALVVHPIWLGALPSDTLAWVPSAQDRRDARALWEDMRTQPGEFLAYNYSFVSTVLRGRTYAVGDRLFDFAGGFDAATFRRPDLARYPRDFLDAIRERRYAAIYTNGAGIYGDPIEALIRQHYVPSRTFGRLEAPSGTPRWRWCTPRVKWLPRGG